MATHVAGTWYADPSHFRRAARRDFLYAGWLGGAGLTLGHLLRWEASAAEGGGKKIEPKAKSVIHIYLQGGFAHMDSFDPKPDAPPEYRGANKALMSPGDRPQPIVGGGKVARGLLA